MAKLGRRSTCRQSPAAAKKVYEFSATTPNPPQASLLQWAWLGRFPACSLPRGVSPTEGSKSFGVALSKCLAQWWHVGVGQDLSLCPPSENPHQGRLFLCTRRASEGI